MGGCCERSNPEPVRVRDGRRPLEGRIHAEFIYACVRRELNWTPSLGQNRTLTMKMARRLLEERNGLPSMALDTKEYKAIVQELVEKVWSLG